MPDEQHDLELKWPHTEPSEVILSGTFNNWARTFLLSRGPDGFSGKISIPWGSKTAYKFIVDGTWMTRDDQPTERDHDGNINNIYTAPTEPSLNATLLAPSNTSTVTNGAITPQPSTNFTSEALDAVKGKPQTNGEHLAAQTPSRPASTSSFPQLVSDLADTVAARDGTSGALDYVASGLGKVIHGVVGVDPINSDQIAIPTPLPTSETVRSEFDLPSSIEASEPRPSVQEHTARAPEATVTDNGSKPIMEEGVAHDVPVPILPVTAPENNPISQPSSLAVVANTADAVRPKEDEQPSTHGIVPIVNGNSSVTEQAKAEEKARDTDLPANKPELESSEAAILMEAGLTSGDDPSKSSTQPTVGSISAKEVKEGRPQTTEPLEGAAIDVGPTTTIPLAEPTPQSNSLAEKQVKDARLGNDSNFISLPNEASAAPAAGLEESQGRTIDTPQVNTPDSDMNPASVLMPKETPVGQIASASAPENAIQGSKHTGQPMSTSVPPSRETETHQAESHKEDADQLVNVALNAPKFPSAGKGEDVVEPVVAAATTSKASESEVKQEEGIEKAESKPTLPEVKPTTKEEDIPVPSTVSDPDQARTSVAQSAEAIKSGVNGDTKKDNKQPERPATPIATKEPFPSTGDSSSPSTSPSSSKTGTAATRKKKRSIFGKIKHLFDHDKDKAKAKATK